VRYARNPQVLWRSTSRGPVLLGPDDETPQRLDGPAAIVWEVLDAPLDPSAIEDEVAAVAEGLTGVEAAILELVDLALVVTLR